MSEPNARLLLSITGVSAVIGYIAAITLGLQGNQGVALIFLAFSLLDTVATFVIYRYYAGLRGARWQDELKESEEKLREALGTTDDRQPTTDDGVKRKKP